MSACEYVGCSCAECQHLCQKVTRAGIEIDKGLVKVGNHWVPWHYQLCYEAGQIKALSKPEDINHGFPTVTWNEQRQMFKVAFAGADTGGHNAQPFEWYFETIHDILKELKLTVSDCLSGIPSDTTPAADVGPKEVVLDETEVLSKGYF